MQTLLLGLIKTVIGPLLIEFHQGPVVRS